MCLVKKLWISPNQICREIARKYSTFQTMKLDDFFSKFLDHLWANQLKQKFGYTIIGRILVSELSKQ